MPYFRADGDPVFDSFFNSIWFTVITITTIGYGDISPCTVIGRSITIVLALWGALLLALLVVTVSNIFNLDDNQKMAMRQVGITKKAAETIFTSLKYCIDKKKLHLLKLK